MKELDFRHREPTLSRCYQSHPPLDVGGGRLIYGGSCSRPSVTDADVYLGLDFGMEVNFAAPWNAKGCRCPVHVKFEVNDMGAPKSAPEFKRMIEWLSTTLDEGKKVHVGCIGGHGRTGTLLAALVAHRKRSDNPIEYVRENYCKKAVESRVQVEFLREHYGCPEVKGAKEFSGLRRSSSRNLDDYLGSYSSSHSSSTFTSVSSSKAIDSGRPVRTAKSIWRDQAVTLGS